jgi:muramoyltetrapeptide carboxypeptidase
MIQVGVVASSSVIPQVEFEIGRKFLESEGFQVECHPSIFSEYFFYPAPDDERAAALIEFSKRDDLDVIWCARGGYGATHLLPYLDRAKKSLQSKKKKVVVGYSDATALMEWFRVNLGWKTIHAPMPSLRTFSILEASEWSLIKSLIARSTKASKAKVEYTHALTPIFLPKRFNKVEAPLVGGNFFVWNSMLGTKNAGNARGKILFLEEIQENAGRLNRFVHHLEQTGGFKGTRAVVLGDFLDCPDSVPTCLIDSPPAGIDLGEYLKNPPKEALGYLRKIYTSDAALDFVFRGLGERNQIPVFKGVPAGHGPHFSPLYLGQKHSLTKAGKFQFKSS